MIPWETFAIPLNLPQNLTQGRSRHAAVESEVKSCKILHPEVKFKENRSKICFKSEVWVCFHHFHPGTVRLLSQEHLVRTSGPEILAKTKKNQGKPKKTKEKRKNPRVPSRDQARPLACSLAVSYLAWEMCSLCFQGISGKGLGNSSNSSGNVYGVVVE